LLDGFLIKRVARVAIRQKPDVSGNPGHPHMSIQLSVKGNRQYLIDHYSSFIDHHTLSASQTASPALLSMVIFIITIPVSSLGKKSVDFCGIRSPASATSRTC